jgi:hypothetical protein
MASPVVLTMRSLWLSMAGSIRSMGLQRFERGDRIGAHQAGIVGRKNGCQSSFDTITCHKNPPLGLGPL